MKSLLCLCLILAVSCSTEPGDPVSSGLPDATSQDAAGDIASQPDGAGDLEGPDLGMDLAGDGGSDLLEHCLPGEGCFLDPCQEASDCQSGICLEHLGDSVCTVQCVEDCPAGWDCAQLTAFEPDVVFACVSPFAQLCRPCTTGTDCSGAGTEDVCVRYPDEGSFCGAACATHEDCPDGYACLDSMTTDGADVKQCVHGEGVCPCSQAAIALGLTTPCDGSNEWGTCEGTRACAVGGLTGCSAPAPAQEVCDGADNDCDGALDEATCDDANPCTQDACNGVDGCGHIALEGTNCDDQDPCTVTDHCQAGQCIGTTVVCDDGNPCTDDLCDGAQGCQFVDNSQACDDDDPCTVADSCKGGECVGTAVSCDCQTLADCAAMDDGNPCNGTLVCDTTSLPYHCKVAPGTVVTCPQPAGPNGACLVSVCNPEGGQCEALPANDGGVCSDGDTCTLGDVCAQGVCAGAFALDCSDGNPCTKDTCNPFSGCGHSPIPEVCDDGNPCTTSDQCVNGQCAAGGFLNCSDNNVCTDDYCDPAEGCVNVANTAPCNDGNQCTVADTCTGGLCQAGAPVSCDDLNGCTTDSCLPLVGCTHGSNSLPCDDGDPCSNNDSCSGGVCLGLGSKNCDDGNPCTTDFCNPMVGCDHGNSTAPCDDGDVCTVGDVCALGTCHSGAPVSCNDGNPCTEDSCLPQEGCVHADAGGGCDDLNECTIGDQCVGGVCMGEGALACDDDNPCTLDICLPQGGCAHEDLSGPCSDGDLCTVNDSCQQGLCAPGPAPICDDGNPCTEDSCGAGGCQFAPLIGAPCDDGNDCTQTDACVAGLCVGTVAKDCDDGDVCTTDYCDPAQGCVHLLNTAPCNDGDVCTLGDACHLGACIGAALLVCEDSNACTQDSCNSLVGCQFTPIPGDCDDGIFCTIGDHCVSGQCLPTAFETCDDGNPCTDDTCDFMEGCQHSSNTDPCDNGDLCTAGDSCVAGQCEAGVAIVCDDANVCTDDGCASDTGCEVTANAAGCDDGDACTDGDVCADATCSGAPISCVDGDLCTNDSCDPDTGCVFSVIPNCCGNHITEPPEQCDDGNQQSGDGCSATCQSEFFAFQSSQVIDGKTVTCSSTTNNGTYTQCDNLKVDGLYFPNGIQCGPLWSSANSSYSNTQGFCASLTGSNQFSVYYVCNNSQPRATWYNHVWGFFNDNGYTQHVRCYY
ncbi:MAG: hypothetical protein ABIK09_06515 [Pseudomonadota bacterium]